MMLKKSKHRRNIRNVALIMLIFIFLLPFMTLPIHAAKANKVKVYSEHASRNINLMQIRVPHLILASTTQNNTKVHQISHEEIVRLTSLFMEQLVQKTDEKFRVLKYDSKDALIKSFRYISSLKLAKSYVDFYYKEYNNKLYIIPTETPAWFEPNQKYKKVQMNDKQVKVIQHNQSELFGNYTISIIFQYANEGWIIKDIKHVYSKKKQ